MKKKLSKKEILYIAKLAKDRHDIKHNGYKNASQNIPEEKRDGFAQNYSMDKNYMPHFVGLVGEYAWSLYTGEKLDENIYKVKDCGQDFDGIEVKTITYFGDGEPELKITEKEYNSRKVPDFYVLCRYNTSTKEVELLGKISRADFDLNKKRKKYGRFLPANFVVPLSKMERI